MYIWNGIYKAVLTLYKFMYNIVLEYHYLVYNEWKVPHLIDYLKLQKIVKLN